MFSFNFTFNVYPSRFPIIHSKVQHNTLTFGSGVLVFLGLRDGRQEEEVAEEEVGKEG